MSFRLMQFPPQSSTRVIRMLAIREPWSESAMYSAKAGLWQSWIHNDEADRQDRTKWGAISGLALSLVVSAGFWTGLAVLVGRILR